MKETVYVIGHKNPDTDSICSAIAYAFLKSCLDNKQIYQAARIGELNLETSFVLNYFNIDEPPFIDNAWTKVEDILPGEIITAKPNSSLKEVGELMKKHNIRILPVVDKENRALGIITESDLARRYLEEFGTIDLKKNPLSLKMIAEAIKAKIILSEKKIISGRVIVGAMKPGSMVKYLQPGDVVIIGDRTNAQLKALNAGVSCLVISGGYSPEEKVRRLAKEKKASLLKTSLDSYSAARGIGLSIPASQIMGKVFTSLSKSDLVKDIIDEVVSSSSRAGLVLEDKGILIGILTRTNLINIPREKVILIDHKEISQTIEGIEEAEILEIIDHHRMGDIQTREPIFVISLPFGSTATIVSQEFQRKNKKIPKDLAGCLMASILSDTVLLKSPTTTEVDRQELHRLAEISGIDPMEFGAKMYEEGKQISKISPMELVDYDFKEFFLKDKKIGVSQIETAEPSLIINRKAEIINVMQKLVIDKGFNSVLFMVTDIIQDGTELFVVGDIRSIEKAFKVRIKDHSVFLPGVISRKKQIINKLI